MQKKTSRRIRIFGLFLIIAISAFVVLVSLKKTSIAELVIQEISDYKGISLKSIEVTDLTFQSLIIKKIELEHENSLISANNASICFGLNSCIIEKLSISNKDYLISTDNTICSFKITNFEKIDFPKITIEGFDLKVSTDENIPSVVPHKDETPSIPDLGAILKSLPRIISINKSSIQINKNNYEINALSIKKQIEADSESDLQAKVPLLLEAMTIKITPSPTPLSLRHLRSNITFLLKDHAIKTDLVATLYGTPLHISANANYEISSTDKSISADIVLKKFSLSNLPYYEVSGEDISTDAHLDFESRIRYHEPDGLLVDAEVQILANRFSWAEQNIECEDLIIHFPFTLANGNISAKNSEITISSIDHESLLLEKLLLQFSLDKEVLSLKTLEAHCMNGKATLSPFSTNIHNPSIETNLILSDISLSKLTTLIPDFHGAASGSINGQIPILFSDNKFSTSTSIIQLGQDSGVCKINYTSEGLLTTGIPKDSPEYEKLKLAELALRDLTVDQLKLQFAPETNNALKLMLSGSSNIEEKSFIPWIKGKKPINLDLDLNLNGSLDTIYKHFIKNNFKWNRN